MLHPNFHKTCISSRSDLHFLHTSRYLQQVERHDGGCTALGLRATGPGSGVHLVFTLASSRNASATDAPVMTLVCIHLWVSVHGSWPADFIHEDFTYHNCCPTPPTSQDWFDLGPHGSIRSWPKDGLVESPFKDGQPSPLRSIIPGGNNPFKIKIDIAHTWAICGVGKDCYASCLVFLAHHCRVWGGNTLETQLDNAFQSFKSHCIQKKKTTSIIEFSKQELKIKSYLDNIFCEWYFEN